MFSKISKLYQKHKGNINAFFVVSTVGACYWICGYIAGKTKAEDKYREENFKTRKATLDAIERGEVQFFDSETGDKLTLHKYIDYLENRT